MDSFINGVLARWMANAALAAIGKPYRDIAPSTSPQTYAVFRIIPRHAKVKGFFSRDSKIEKHVIEFRILSTEGIEGVKQTALHDGGPTNGFDFARFDIEDGVVAMYRIGQSGGECGFDARSKKHVYDAISVYEAEVERFVPTT